MPNVKYRSTYYNTTGSSVLWTVEILDTETVAQVINFECVSPNESFEGLTYDLNPGVYPSSFKIGMYITDRIHVKHGKTIGPSNGFISDLLTSDEGRFYLQIKKAGVLHFAGVLLPDQCSYEDASDPYKLNIVAVDGLVRLGSVDYMSLRSEVAYSTCSTTDIDGTVLETTPDDSCLVGSEWLLISFNSVLSDSGGAYSDSDYARLEQIAPSSPGTGWVDQGGGLWAKEIDRSNETITSETDYYRIHWDISDEPRITISDYFQRGLAEIEMDAFYPSPTIMYDQTCEWYENNMGSLVTDSFTQIRLSEIKFKGKNWREVFQEICKLFYIRIYYSKGRYHFEQITTRVNQNIVRHGYESDGTLISSLSTDLDLDISALTIKPGTGGLNKMLPPLRKVEVEVELESGDMIAGLDWKNSKGSKIVGRIKRDSGTHKLRYSSIFQIQTTYDYDTMLALPESLRASMSYHDYHVYYLIRIVDLATDITYYSDETGAWVTSEPEINKYYRLGGTSTGSFALDRLNITKNINISHTSRDLPGSDGDTFDVYFSMWWNVQYDNLNGRSYWQGTNPDKASWNGTLYQDSLASIDENGDLIENKAKRVYTRESATTNTKEVKVKVLFADTGQGNSAIQINDGTNWINSADWSINGTGTAQPVLGLLAGEIIALRTKHRRIYSGSYLSSLPLPDNRLKRGTVYYLPLACSRDSDLDSFSGEFLEIARTEPSTGVTVDTIDEDNDNQEPTNDDGIEGVDDPPIIEMAFETDAIITASSTLTQVAIVNTSGVFIQEGTIVDILHPTSGAIENVVLSADINPTDTIMYFDSHNFTFGFPDASPIVPRIDEGLFPTSLDQVYYFFKSNYTASSISAPNFNFVDEEAVGLHDINKRYKLKRNGVRIFCKFGVTDPLEKIQTYYFDDGAKTWNFYIGLDGETIQIEAF